ncbi:MULTISPECIES: hypothetical protein [unclassified Streptomyces]|uniref:hypothetical protein n=1 Tax=unclassified Streptomyces TaxID=2593676 RepID=UPI001AF436F5|nr:MULTISPECIES: hypothetical protein [unclassified Streptomyces]CAD5960941.1 conserved protein of unknown function [Streptomyces sp. KY70]CAD5980179.1 conserved protein of unknown function [Streptomyces sp. KY75]
MSVLRPAGPGVLSDGPGGLRAMQQTLGNEATARAVRRGKRPANRPPAIDERAEQGLVLPPYLMELEAGGLSTAYGLTGQEFVGSAVAAVVGHGGGTVAAISAELAGRPESFFGRGRAFAVEGAEGGQGGRNGQGGNGFDVTVSIEPAPDDLPPTFHPAATLASAPPDPGGAPLAAVDDAEGKDTKVDVQHNSGTTASSTVGNSSSTGAGGTAFGLAPVAPGLWLGAAATGSVQPWQSSRDSRSQRGVAEPRVLRSDSGSVEVARRVVYVVRVRRQEGGDEQVFRGTGGLTQRVPTEHLIPAGTEPLPSSGAGGQERPVDADLARRVALADSLAPLGVSDSAGPHQGGGGLFDAVASVLHPSVTAPGAPGRSRLYEATATPTVLEDLPRLLGGDGVTGDDLYSKDGSSAGSYRMRAVVTGLTSAWGTGKTQLRTHQQAQHTATESAGKGRSVAGGIGPAIGVGAAANAAVVRATAMPVAAARKARFSVNEQTVSSRQGAEVRGEKVLYRGTVQFTVEGTGPRSVRAILRPEARVATHALRVWISLRADEARELGLPLPQGVEAGEFIKQPEAGAEERHLPFGATGSSVTLGRLDTAPMMKAVRELFATDPRLTGYLPAFGATPPPADLSREEEEAQRANDRELMAALSEANLRVNKDQLLSTGIRVRLRRKTAMHAHDVQLRVHGTMGEAHHLGEIDDWLVRAHAGVAANAQTGRSSSRSIGGMVLAQARLIPGVLTGSARYERQSSGTRRNQAGPTTRTDVLTNGSEKASAFGAALRLNVDVTMTSRQRKLARAVAPGGPGRDVPEAKLLSGLHMEEQDVRLLTPSEFTVGPDEKARLDAGAGQAPGAERPVTGAAGIGDLAGLAPTPTAGQLVRDWQLVETIGDGQPVRDLALALLSRAAARGEAGRRDEALGTEGLAPRLAVEERFSPRAITASLRQAASSGWVVRNLRYPRRMAALNGAVGTRLALSSPQLVHEAAGPGTETFILGGHQAGGQQGEGTSTTVQAGATLVQNGPEWRVGEGLSASWSTSTGDTEAATVSGSVERNAHTPKKAPLYLVRCDLLVTMVAEVKVTGGGPYVAGSARTLRGAAAVWLTAEQLRAAGVDLPESARKALKLERPRPENRPTTSRAEGSGGGTQTPAREGVGATGGGPSRPGPGLSRDLPLGFGMIEDLPDFVPLLEGLRGNLATTGRQDLADDLLPRQQLRDRNDNVQRLLRVLDRDGSAGLLASAMDGGVTVELLDGRRTPYWAVFKVVRSGDGVREGEADDGRDMEYITSAAAQQATSHDEGESTGVEGVLAGSGKPDGGVGQLKSVGGAAGLGLGSSSGRRRGGAARGQLGMKTVAEAKTAKSAKVRVPIVASLELHQGEGRLAMAGSGRTSLVHRILESDLTALRRVTTPRRAPRPAPGAPTGGQAGLGTWRAAGVPLPMEAQANGFQGAPRVRELVNATVRAAGGDDRFREKGQAAAYTLGEAVSTEWLIAALPLLTNAGAELPPVHASGAKGQDLNASVHARLRAGRVLGTGDKMTFETAAQSHLGAPRPTQTDGQSAAEQSRQARGLLGAGVLNADEFRLNQLMGNTGGSGSATGAATNAAGSMPLHKPKFASVLIQFTLDIRVVARVTDRVRTSNTQVAERDLTLPTPVVIRMPLPVAGRLLAAHPTEIADPHDRLGLRTGAVPPGP